MHDYKLIGIKILPSSRQVNEFVTYHPSSNTNITTTVYESPEFERALRPYLEQGYWIAGSFEWDARIRHFLLEREI